MRNNGGRLGLAALVLLVVSACAEEKPPIVADPTPSVTTSPSEVSPTESATESPASDGPVVTLVDAGQEPRQQLRLQFAQGDTQSATMTMRMKIKVSANGKTAPVPTLPTMSIGMSARITDVAADGTIAASFGYDDFSVDGDSELARQTEKGLAGISKLRGSLRMTSRGEVLDAAFSAPSGLPDSVSATLESFEDQLRNFVVPLPEEAVGEGASWTVRSQTKLNGIRADLETHYEVLALTGNGVELEVTTEQTAPEQAIKLPTMPKAVNTYLSSMDIKGTGHSTLEFGSIFPVSSSAVASGAMKMSMWDSSHSIDMVQHMEMIMGMESR